MNPWMNAAGGQQPEQRHQRVHPRLLAVGSYERVERKEHGGKQPGPAAEQAPRHPGAGRDRQRSEQLGHSVGCRLRVAEPAHPDMQQQVIERRRAVVVQNVGDVRQRVRGDADRERLVHPELAVDVSGSQVDGRRGEDEQEPPDPDLRGHALEPRRRADVEVRQRTARGDGGGHGPGSGYPAVFPDPKGPVMRNLVVRNVRPCAQQRQQVRISLGARLEDHVGRRRRSLPGLEHR